MSEKNQVLIADSRTMRENKKHLTYAILALKEKMDEPKINLGLLKIKKCYMGLMIQGDREWH
ncbi:hypothetical protein PN36_05395 [Candidatus Thiomargarita nelsonii]|uniref:Uncharacterized protein n=1 Tax=Candidatus Thiomargarita nelsonii TaxID=1003181 RepID=A0A4E0QS13_9GAMM|nr:hypothetical protein PN36_05395 [Candidatus Thiomargarita nelsonii]